MPMGSSISLSLILCKQGLLLLLGDTEVVGNTEVVCALGELGMLNTQGCSFKGSDA